ncbi:MAG: hypothetical protein ACKPKO_32145 [Candidatus Fonsibacter sp.]
MISYVYESCITVDLGWGQLRCNAGMFEYAIVIIYIGGIPLSHFGFKRAYYIFIYLSPFLRSDGMHHGEPTWPRPIVTYMVIS